MQSDTGPVDVEVDGDVVTVGLDLIDHGAYDGGLLIARLSAAATDALWPFEVATICESP